MRSPPSNLPSPAIRPSATATSTSSHSFVKAANTRAPATTRSGGSSPRATAMRRARSVIEDEVVGTDRSPGQLPARSRAQRGQDRGAGRYRRRLTYSAEAVGRMRSTELEHLGGDGRHVEDRGYEVVGPRWVLDAAV